MSRIQPLGRRAIGDCEPILEAVEAALGFGPNSMLTMAHWPALLHAFAGLGGTELGAER